MKKLLFSVLVVFFCFVMIQADRENPRSFEGDPQIAGRLAEMRATLAAEGHTFEIGYNEAMNYSLEQLCTFKPGKTAEGDAQVENQDDTGIIALPIVYTGYCGLIRNQGSCGGAWAYAIIGQIEAQWRKVTGVYYDFSEIFLIYCNSYGYGCHGGGFNAFNDCTCPNYFKYEGTWLPGDDCNDPYGDAGCCSSWAYVGNSSSVPTTAAIKQKIYDKGAVAAAVYADSYFQAYTSGCFNRNASGSVNHAVVLCGWDDNRCGTGIGAWRLKNSWGTAWGESGFMWIKYGCQKVGYAACYGNY
ncbi:MAG: hypothetical protein MUF15_14680 [Acidobacteria bacterium]|jgi:hypothetical protein|nr:hypothetical protein [Acidobacteriota bacterium]